MGTIRLSVLWTLGAAVALAQFPPGGGGYPPGGGYPGGGYPPGGPNGRNPQGTGGTSIPQIPRGKKKTNAEEMNATSSIRGLLRKFADTELVLEAEDKRILHIRHSSSTKFLEGSKTLDPGDLQPGDHLFIETSADDRGRFFAVRVTFEKGGTPSERAAARQPVGDDVKMSDDEPAPAAKSDDPDRPRMKRAAGSSSESAKTSDKPKSDDDRPVMKRADSGSKPDTAKSDDDRPKMKRAGSASDADKAADADSDVVLNPTEVRTASGRDPDAPKLVRGKPAPHKSSDEVEVAEARPIDRSASDQSLSGGRRAMEERGARNTLPAGTQQPGSQQAPQQERQAAAPAAPEREADPFIEKASEMATSFVESLPNYVVKQLTTRFYSTSSKASWIPQDNIQTDLVYENGREQYRNILVNGKAPKGKVEETGAWSTGEFASVLMDLFSPATAADFRARGSDTISHRAAKVYGFTVDQPNSHWQVHAEAQSYKPAYKGTVWIDKETQRVLRIEMQAKNMPKDFPLDTVESATDYDFIRLSNSSFLLPTHSEVLSCVRGTNQCSRNVIDFRNYRKFGAESDIIFKP